MRRIIPKINMNYLSAIGLPLTVLLWMSFFTVAFQSIATPHTSRTLVTTERLPYKKRHRFHMPPLCSRKDNEDISNGISSTKSKIKKKPSKDTEKEIAPLVMASGYSQDIDMKVAIQQAVKMAIDALPVATNRSQIDLAIVTVSSLYDGSVSPSLVVPTCLEAAGSYGKGIQHLIGSTSGGFIGSRAAFDPISLGKDDQNDDKFVRACAPVEQEGVPGTSIVLCMLPDVHIETFHVLGDDVPDDYGRVSSETWKGSIGLRDADTSSKRGRNKSKIIIEDDSKIAFLIPSPAFSNDLDDLLRGMTMHLPGCTVFGAVASTVSSLSRARLFRHDASSDEIQTFAEGCVGVIMSGDIQVKTMVAQGAKPVGGVYQIMKGQESTISTIALDETVTNLVRQAETLESSNDDEGNDEETAGYEDGTKASQLAASYAKARIPKPVLAEANFVMKTLSDDDQAFMQKALLVGLERGGALGRTPSELARLAEGKGHNFSVHQVASASMKDGSVTLSLGSVNIEQGSRMRFFVRESTFAKKEVQALWTGYKKRALIASLKDTDPKFLPAGCFLFPTLDRGNKFFLDRSGFESSTTSQFLPTIPAIWGFFSNGVIGALNAGQGLDSSGTAALNGSGTGYILIGSRSERPVYYPSKVAASRTVQKPSKKTGNHEQTDSFGQKAFEMKQKAPRDDKGELIFKRREVHSGRALTVSTVEWSVAEKTASPTSALEGFMWEKETEVDRFRERVPLANLVSQCKLSTMDPSKPKPRDWIGTVKKASEEGKFVVIPECKRIEPRTGSLRKRYDIEKLVKEYVNHRAPAIAVNCDAVLFGGKLDDLTRAREASSKVTLDLASTESDKVSIPPILASDLLLYPYQLYKLRLAGADAVNLLVGALATKDLVYLTKIARSLQMQSLLTVTSIAQLDRLVNSLTPGSIDGLIVSNRELEDFSFDMTGQQVLRILKSSTMEEFRRIHEQEMPMLVEGRVGIITTNGENGKEIIDAYIEELKDAGATGAIVGGGMASDLASRLFIEKSFCL